MLIKVMPFQEDQIINVILLERGYFDNKDCAHLTFGWFSQWNGIISLILANIHILLSNDDTINEEEEDEIILRK